MRRLAALAVICALSLAGAFGASGAAAAVPVCKKGTPAIVKGKHACLRERARCTIALDREYKQFGYRCRKPKRARRGVRTSKLTLGNAKARRFGEPVDVRPDGSVDKKTALQAFAATIGPLPGVKVPKGAVDPQESGTAVLHWVEAYRARLSAAQRAAVDRYRQQLFPDVSAASADEATAKGYVDDAIKSIQGHLGKSLGVPTKVVFGEVPTAKGALAAETVVDGPSGKVCLVTVTKLGLAEPEEGLRSALGHEAFHCFQDVWNPTGYGADTLWLWEGSATYVAAVLDADRGQVNKHVQEWWETWLTWPRAPLNERSYGAIGFFSHLDESGIDFWKTIESMIRTGSAAGAYSVAAESPPQAPVMLDTWAPSYFRVSFPGPGWDFRGPAIPAGVKPTVPKYPLANGGSQTIESFPLAAGGGQLSLGADVVKVVPGGSGEVHGRMTDLDGDQFPLGAGSYCAKPGGCTCPDGKLGPPDRLDGGVLVGVTGHEDGASVEFQGESLAKYCKHAPAAGTMTVSGPISGRVTTAGSCTTSFAGSPGSFLSSWNTDAEPTYYVQIDTENWSGPGNYEAKGRGVTSGPRVSATDGKGRVWATEDRPEGAVGGGFTVDSETATTISGTVNAFPYSKAEGTTVTVSGSWSCKKD